MKMKTWNWGFRNSWVKLKIFSFFIFCIFKNKPDEHDFKSFSFCKMKKPAWKRYRTPPYLPPIFGSRPIFTPLIKQRKGKQWSNLQFFTVSPSSPLTIFVIFSRIVSISSFSSLQYLAFRFRYSEKVIIQDSK
jgi:hypothetical protein